MTAKRGHDVTRWEKGPALGGQAALAAQAPHHAEWGQLVEHLAVQVERLGVDVRLNTEATAEAILADTPDAVIVATGAVAGLPPFAVKGETHVLTEWDLFNGETPAEQNLLLLDMGVKFEGGAVVETLAERGNHVQWITPNFVVGAGIDPSSLIPLRRRLAEHGVDCTPETTIIEADGDTVMLMNVITNEVQPTSGVDAIVVAGIKVANDSLYRQLKGTVPELHRIGDSVAPRNVTRAIYEGRKLGAQYSATLR